jgi:uncharacterized membrane protein
MARSGTGHKIGWIVAAVLVAAGAMVTVVGLMTPVSYGWFAYQPLADATFTPGGDGVWLARATVVGLLLLALGLIALAFLIGRRVGSSREN